LEIRLDGKVALITGIGGGQGRAAALLFAQSGASVIGCDLKADGCDDTLRMAKESGLQIQSRAPVDLGDRAQARGWVGWAASVHGQIDILYNNASATRLEPFETQTDESWDFTMRNEIDLVATVTRAAWPYLKARGGVVLTTASIAGFQPLTGVPSVAHGAAKAAMLGFTKQIACEGAAHNIRAVSISPGFISTPATDEQPMAKDYAIARNYIKRVGVPEDIASAALFLASDLAGYITGTDLVIDGGCSCA
jgi:NAD(P)-dependent dehydrogenase (short-subunit alcohol dehydrogenase family)